MVPTATILPPLALTAFSAAATSSDTIPVSSCMTWPPVSALRTGKKVPGPTCKVTKCNETPRARSASINGSGEMQASGRRRHRTFLARKNGLVVDAVLFVRRPPRGDVGRKRHGAQMIDRLIEACIAEIEGERHLAFGAALFDRRGKSPEQAHALPLAEHDAVAGLQPLGGTGQRRPAVGIEAAR